MTISGKTTHRIDHHEGPRIRVQFFREDEDGLVPLTYRDYPAEAVENDMEGIVTGYATEYQRHLHPVQPTEIEEADQQAAAVDIDAIIDDGGTDVPHKKTARRATARKK